MDLQSNFYKVKTFETKVEDVDRRSRKVKMYLSTFDVKDAYGDVIKKGAFTKSLSEKGPESSSFRKIQHLRNHDWNQLVGKFVELYEDNYGLVGVSELGRSTKGEDTLLDYEDGLIKEHSIGYKEIRGKSLIKNDAQFGKHKELTELNLFEGSSVTFGANELTPVIDVNTKSIDQISTLDKIQKLTKDIYDSLKNGEGTDERLMFLEYKLAQLQELQNSLKDLKPSTKDTLDIEPNEEDKTNQLFTNLLKIY